MLITLATHLNNTLINKGSDGITVSGWCAFYTVQCGDNSAKKKIKWWSMYTGKRTNICCRSSFMYFNSANRSLLWLPSFHGFWHMTATPKWEGWGDESFFFFLLYNLGPKHSRNALWSCQNGIKTFISTSHKSPFPFWLTTVCQKRKVLCLRLHSRLLREPRVATTVSKILPVNVS